MPPLPSTRGSAPAALLLLALACQRPAPPQAAPVTPRWQQELPTTAGSIAQGNLDSEIAGQERVQQLNPHPARLMALSDLYSTRAQYFGQLADYDRAAALAERLVNEQPADGQVYLLRARTRASLHRFEDARADMERAAQRGVKPEALEGLRASILQAQGHMDEALVLVQGIAQRRPDIVSIGAEAALLGDRGELDLAEQRFAEARRHYRDVSPMPVAWLCFQQATMWQSAGRPARARELLTEAHERLPGYAQVTAHLAAVEDALGDRPRAIELLRPLLSSSDDPEYAGELARLLAESGQREEAGRLRAQARAGYQALLARHPQAFASHAARFFLSDGDPQRALALARQNLQVSATPAARELVMEAANAALPPAAACEVADSVAAGPYPTPRLKVLLARALVACGRKAEAALRAGDAQSRSR